MFFFNIKTCNYFVSVLVAKIQQFFKRAADFLKNFKIRR
jgi:hypothetical protein